MQKGRHKEVLFFCPTVGGARTLWPGLREAPTGLQSSGRGRGHHTEQLRTRSVLNQNRKKKNKSQKFPLCLTVFAHAVRFH